MYIEVFVLRIIGDKVWLVLEIFESLKILVRCMFFWYNMNGV